MKGGSKRQQLTPTELMDAHRDLWDELQIALSQHTPGVFASPHEALGCITEEFHEFVEAVRSNRTTEIVQEAMDLAILGLFTVACFDTRHHSAEWATKRAVEAKSPFATGYSRYRGYHLITFKEAVKIYNKGLLRGSKFKRFVNSMDNAIELIDEWENNANRGTHEA